MKGVIDYRIVDQKHVLWTCHKACKIEYSDCCFCVCSVCYNDMTVDVTTSKKKVHKKQSKRRRTSRSVDDDITICKHNVEDLVPFMDQSFFSKKYKITIAQEKYKLPVVCSICENELVDRIRSDDTSIMNSESVGIVEI